MNPTISSSRGPRVSAILPQTGPLMYTPTKMELISGYKATHEKRTVSRNSEYIQYGMCQMKTCAQLREVCWIYVVSIVNKFK
jgi:hypothetical protein